MAEHPNAAIIRRYLEANTSNDVEAAANLMADDVEWHEIGRTEPIRGKAALAERYMGTDAPEWKITSGETHDIIGGDNHTIALLSAHAVWGDKSLDYRVAEVYHIRDGKITARWAMSDDTAAINNFFKGT
jgi:ketosteroid isomerase-like protein